VREFHDVVAQNAAGATLPSTTPALALLRPHTANIIL
jgi:hypothetical protein